jgi:hypothetical protein
VGEIMFEDSSSLENQAQETQKPSEEEGQPSRWLSRWSHVIAGLVFCLLYFPFQSHPWCWPVAIAGSYTVFAFAIALGLAFDNTDDFFGDPRAPKNVAKLLMPHTLILALIILAAYLWLRLKSILPPWITHESHRGSWWDLCLLLLVWFAGTREGVWMAGRIKSGLPERED